MTFIDAWLVWLLAMTQPNAPTNVGPQVQRTEVRTAHPTHRADDGKQKSVFSTSSWAVQTAPVTGRSDLRAVTQISNGY